MASLRRDGLGTQYCSLIGLFFNHTALGRVLNIRRLVFVLLVVSISVHLIKQRMRLVDKVGHEASNCMKIYKTHMQDQRFEQHVSMPHVLHDNRKVVVWCTNEVWTNSDSKVLNRHVILLFII